MNDHTALPTEFKDEMQSLLGGEYPRFLQAMREPPKAGLYMNPLRNTAARPPFDIRAIPGIPGGYTFDTGEKPGNDPCHEAGLYYVQEPSAMRAPGLLGVTDGDFVLDLCAAPGGKAASLCFAAGKAGFFMANEIVPARAKILAENLERMGLGHAVITNEAPARLADKFPAFFDKILVDAPCSGEGMFRKHPGTIEQWSAAAVRGCHERQADILREAARLLRPGGSMLYCTCTFNRLENEGSVSRFLAEHPDFILERSIRLYPHTDLGEGHFAALLKKDGDAGRRVLPDNPRIFLHELEDIVCGKAFPKTFAFGEYVCAVPACAPPPSAFDGLKLVRYGLQLYSKKGSTVLPAHALAMALSPAEAGRFIDLSKQDAVKFIAGEAPEYGGTPGFTLVCYENLPLGWAKAVPGRLQNHRPKGLRKQLRSIAFRPLA